MPEEYDRVDDRTEDEDESVGAGSGTTATFSSGNQNTGPRARVGDDGDGNVDETDYDDDGNAISTPTILPSGNTVVGAPFVAKIEVVDGTRIMIDRTWNQFKDLTGLDRQVIASYPGVKFEDVSVSTKGRDMRNLNTFLHFGDDNLKLAVNATLDKSTVPDYPHSTIFKLYEPLDEDIEEKNNVYVVEEIIPELIEEVELVPYDQEEEQVTVLRRIESSNVDSPVSQRKVDFKNYNQLVTTDSNLQKQIADKYISGSENPVNLNVDYAKYENFVNFSSAEKRLSNFKYKIQQIEKFTAQSSSFVGVTGSEKDLQKADNSIRDIKNNFDGYESYLYNVSSSYVTSSMGEFKDASWPKTGSGVFADPFVPVSSSAASFTSWYGSVSSKTGQSYSASLYDIENDNRLVNLLPHHIKQDIDNKYFLDFIDMIAQQFDELWLYTKAIADVNDRQYDLNTGFSKDILYNLAKSLGWSVNDGKDLIDLSRAGFGQKLENNSYSLYTSGSIDSPAEGDISKEITKRLISSMPYILKTKGTINSLKAIINCYGIPSSILRVREYGGLKVQNKRDEFEIARKFTKALGFRSSQYVETSWDNDVNSTRKPETVEFRFRSVSSSDQVLVQKDTDWAIKLKDNGSTDNNGTVSFMLSGSDGYQEISSSVLPVFDGDYYSVMLRKQKIDTELFPSSSFEVPANQGLFNPPFATDGSRSAEHGSIKIVSSSNVARTGTKALQFHNERKIGEVPGFSYTYLHQTSSVFPGDTPIVTNVSQGDSYTLTVYAKASASTVDSVAELSLIEFQGNGFKTLDAEGEDLGRRSSELVGLNENEWKKLTVTKRINFQESTGLGFQLYNHKPGSTILFDDLSIRKNVDNTDTIADAFSYDLFVKKYDAGLDRIRLDSKNSLIITGSHAATQSYNAAWTGSGDLFIGGNSTSEFSANKLTGSLMEFRLWTEPLKEKSFNIHTSNPKSYIGNNPSSSYYHLVRRFSFDDNTALSNGSSIRDVSANQTYTQTGSAQGFGGLNTFESVIDRTKTIIPNHGPNRRTGTKIRIEDNYLSGSGATLSISKRYDTSTNDNSPIDSPKLGIYFSPVDAVNDDIVSSFADLDFNQYLGDPRDNFSENYREIKDIANQYFQKYSGRNNFWDYMRLVKYYDQSVFKQMRKVIPARAKANLGTLIEGNIFERPKSPIQRNNPTLTQPQYEDTINVSNFEAEHEDSRSIVRPGGDYPNYVGVANNRDIFLTPSLYQLQANDNYDDRNRYINASVTRGGPRRVFVEATGSMITDSRLSLHNKEYRFFYTSSADYDRSNKRSADLSENFYTSKSLVDSDLDPEYQFTLALNRSFYEGVKNTIETTTDGKTPIEIRITTPTVAVPVDAGDSDLTVVD